MRLLKQFPKWTLIGPLSRMEARLGVGKQSRRPSMAKCIWRSKASCQSVYDVRDWRIYKHRSFKLGFFSRSFLDDLYYWLTKWHIGCIRNGITKANNWECQTTIFPRTTIAFGSRERNEAWFGVVWNVDRLRFARIDLLTNSCKEKILRVSIIEVSRSTVWICILTLRVEGYKYGRRTKNCAQGITSWC